MNMASKKANSNKTLKRAEFAQLELAAVLCPICRTILIEPVSLPCHHVLCKQCFDDKTEFSNLRCPLCRLRVSSWFRLAKKEGKVVDKEFWRAIQQQYPVEVDNKRQGEGKKALMQRIKRDEDENLRLDALLAKKLAEKLRNTPPTLRLGPRRFKKTENVKQYVAPISSEGLNKPNPIKANKLTLPGSPNNNALLRQPKTKPGKEYTCHVLPVEQRSTRVNPASNLFADLDFKGIFGTLGQKPTKTTNPGRTKSICTSGYKSTSSGDNSDVIDQECKFYFKPINAHRLTDIHRKTPLKVPTVLSVNDGNVPIEPPSGKPIDLFSIKGSAFSRFGNVIEDESTTAELSLLENKRGSPFCGFNSTQIEESLRQRDAMNIEIPKINERICPYQEDISRKQSNSIVIDKSARSTTILNVNLEKSCTTATCPKMVDNFEQINNLNGDSDHINKTNTLGLSCGSLQNVFDGYSEDEGLSQLIDNIVCNNNSQMDCTNAKIDDVFEREQKRLQEEKDFELAKKLQAEFYPVPVSYRTRRGRKRVLDEM